LVEHEILVFVEGFVQGWWLSVELAGSGRSAKSVVRPYSVCIKGEGLAKFPARLNRPVDITGLALA